MRAEAAKFKLVWTALIVHACQLFFEKMLNGTLVNCVAIFNVVHNACGNSYRLIMESKGQELGTSFVSRGMML